MSETIRAVIVTIEVDTNKQTRRENLTIEEGEALNSFKERVATAISALAEELT